MKSNLKYFTPLFFILIINSVYSQYNAIPQSACHVFSGTCQNVTPNYQVTDSGFVCLYENFHCTPSSDAGYNTSISKNDNFTCSVLKSEQDMNDYYLLNILFFDTTTVICRSQMLHNSVMRISNLTKNTTQIMPMFFGSTKITATDRYIYGLSRDYTFDNKIHFSKSDANNVSQMSLFGYTDLKNLPSIYFINDSVGFIFGKDTLDNNVIVRSNDYGNTWSKVFSSTNVYWGMTFKSDTGYAFGPSGALIKSIDQGVTWSQFTNFTTKNINSISIGDSAMYAAAGDSALLFKSIDNGYTWTQEPLSIFDKIIWVKVTKDNAIYFGTENMNEVPYNIHKVYKKNYFISVPEIEAEKNTFVIYPNPSSSLVYFMFDEHKEDVMEVNVIDNLGNIVIKTQQTHIDINALSAGYYTVELRIKSKKVYRNKLLKVSQ